MDFLYLLEKIRNPVFDFFFSLVTHLGEETVFLAVAIIFFWCINKYEGYYILITGLVGTVINQALKLAFRIPRPWVLDPEFEIVESARAEATGYSFPSGHTQNTAGTFGAIGCFAKRRWLSVTMIVVIVLVAFSRMYLGVHTPKDVCVSLLIAAVLLAVLYPVFSSEERFHKFMPIVAAVSIALSVGLLLYAFLVPEEGIDPANLHSARKNASTLFACTLCLLPVYLIDKHYTKFDTKAPWYAQIIKVVVGLGIVLVIKSGLSKPLEMLFGNEFVARGVRYFLIVAFAGIVWPMTFKFFAKMPSYTCEDKNYYAVMTILFNSFGVPCFMQKKAGAGVLTIVLGVCTFGVVGVINAVMGIVKGVQILRMTDEEYQNIDKTTLLSGIPFAK